MKTLLHVLKFLGFVVFSLMASITAVLLISVGILAPLSLVAMALQLEFDVERIAPIVLAMSVPLGLGVSYLMIYASKENPRFTHLIDLLGRSAGFMALNAMGLVVGLTFLSFFLDLLTQVDYHSQPDPVKRMVGDWPAVYIPAVLLIGFSAFVVAAKRDEEPN